MNSSPLLQKLSSEGEALAHEAASAPLAIEEIKRGIVAHAERYLKLYVAERLQFLDNLARLQYQIATAREFQQVRLLEDLQGSHSTTLLQLARCDARISKISAERDGALAVVSRLEKRGITTASLTQIGALSEKGSPRMQGVEDIAAITALRARGVVEPLLGALSTLDTENEEPAGELSELMSVRVAMEDHLEKIWASVA
jgi:hypothetical protein